MYVLSIEMRKEVIYRSENRKITQLKIYLNKNYRVNRFVFFIIVYFVYQ